MSTVTDRCEYCDRYCDGKCAVAKHRKRIAVIEEMLEPLPEFRSKLEYIAWYLDKMDGLIEAATGEHQGSDVQNDLRRWARELRRSQ